MANKKRTRYTAERLRLRNIRFWVLYLVFVVLIILAFRSVHAYFDASLSEYEAAQSDDIIDKTAQLFIDRRFDVLYEYEDQSIDYIESRDDYISYLEELTKNATIEYQEAASLDTSKRKFIVTADGKSFASFTIRKSGEAAEFELIPLIGYKLKAEKYEFDSISSSVLRPASYEVTLRDTDTLYVNGSELPEKYIVKKGVPLFYEGHLPETMVSPKLDTYRFTCALDEPEIKVLDMNGEEYELETEDGYVLNYVFTYQDDELKPQFEEQALTCVKNISLYTTKNISREKVLKLMVSDSKAADFIKNIDGMWLTKADKYTFENVKTQNYAMFSDNVFSCDVSFDYNTVSKGKANSYPVSYRLYYIKTENDWLVYDLENL